MFVHHRYTTGMSTYRKRTSAGRLRAEARPLRHFTPPRMAIRQTPEVSS
jgi:hypothetical protein